MTGVFTKSKCLRCITGDSESLGMGKESREGEKKKVNNNYDKHQVQVFVMIHVLSSSDFLF